MWFSDQVASMILAHTGHDGDDLWCRRAGSTMNYAQVRHTQPEASKCYSTWTRGNCSRVNKWQRWPANLPIRSMHASRR